MKSVRNRKSKGRPPVQALFVLHVTPEGEERVYFFQTHRKAAQAAMQMKGYSRIRVVPFHDLRA